MLRTGRLLLFLCFAGIAAGAAFAQETKPVATPTKDQPGTRSYIRPTFRQRVKNYEITTFGPLQMTTLALGSAISQAHNVPPEWGQGWGAYGKRFASDVGSSTSAGTTNFLLGEALGEDTRYYPCACKGFWPRFGHVMISSITAHAGKRGFRVFSAPAVVSPYAGSFSTLLWYPGRYGPKDAFRSGNYDFLDSIGMKLALEFLGPVFRKFHM
jgi:hypothetical protein